MANTKSLRLAVGAIFPKGPGKIYFYRYQVDGRRKTVSLQTAAIHWASYLAKVSTKNAPYRQRTYDYSRGFRNHPSGSIATYTLQEEKMFDELDLAISEQDWEAWGPENYDFEKELNFDPRTGGPFHPEPQETPSPAQKIQENLPYGLTSRTSFLRLDNTATGIGHGPV